MDNCIYYFSYFICFYALINSLAVVEVYMADKCIFGMVKTVH